MSEGQAQVALMRKWVPIAGGSCDVRMGSDAIGRSSKVFSSAVGRVRACIVVLEEGTDDSITEKMRRELVSVGFKVSWHHVPARGCATLEAVAELVDVLARERITSDDLCCVLGGADIISMASFVCGSWCGGMAMVAIPTDEIGFLEGALSPRPISAGGRERMLSVRPCVRHVVFDYDEALSPMGSEASLYLRTLMVASAMSGSEREFSALWDRADALMADDMDALVTQVMATAKARGQAASSAAVAVRQSIDYGQSFAHALEAVTDGLVSHGIAVAEGLRFSARLAVLLEKLTVDDMLAQDELLDALGVGEAACDVAPADLVLALKRERFDRTNRFMLPVPLAIGRVRLTTVDDSVLAELAEAWCSAHAR